MSPVSDTHGGFAAITRISDIQQNMPEYKPEETMIVILGDCSLNFWLNNTDKKYKKLLNSMNYHIYCVRGNHEQRPELIKNMVLVNDENVNNVVYMEEAFPNIRYFIDGKIYNLLEYKCLVIGGAYSIDKYLRVEGMSWWPQEIPSHVEVEEGLTNLEKVEYNVDYVLTHTCPSHLINELVEGAEPEPTNKILDGFNDLMQYQNWFFGHWHFDHYFKNPNSKFKCLYNDVIALN